MGWPLAVNPRQSVYGLWQTRVADKGNRTRAKHGAREGRLGIRAGSSLTFGLEKRVSEVSVAAASCMRQGSRWRAKTDVG